MMILATTTTGSPSPRKRINANGNGFVSLFAGFLAVESFPSGDDAGLIFWLSDSISETVAAIDGAVLAPIFVALPVVNVWPVLADADGTTVGL